MTPDPDINEQDALHALVTSDGWAFVLAHLEQEWGAQAYARRMDAAIVKAKQENRLAEGDICELSAAVRAVQIFAQWPSERLKQLAAQKPSRNPFARQRRA